MSKNILFIYILILQNSFFKKDLSVGLRITLDLRKQIVVCLQFKFNINMLYVCINFIMSSLLKCEWPS